MKRFRLALVLACSMFGSVARADRVSLDANFQFTPTIDISNIVAGFLQTGTEQGDYLVISYPYSAPADVSAEINLTLSGEVPFAAFSPGYFSQAYGTLFGTYSSVDESGNETHGVVVSLRDTEGIGLSWEEVFPDSLVEEDVYQALVDIGSFSSDQDDISLIFSLLSNGASVWTQYQETGVPNYYLLGGNMVAFSSGEAVATLWGSATFGTTGVVPEPASLVTMGLGGAFVGLLAIRRRRRGA